MIRAVCPVVMTAVRGLTVTGSDFAVCRLRQAGFT